MSETVRPTTAILLCNLGTPSAPTAPAVRRYLAEFLGDPRVVEIPALIWKPILYGAILPLRPKASAEKYQSVWTEEGSPLLVYTQKQAQALQEALTASGHTDLLVVPAMRYDAPNIATQLDALKAQGIARILILPLYPQYSSTTTASVVDYINAWTRRQRAFPEFRFINDYATDAGYVEALVQSIQAHWAEHGQAQKLVMSFHGIPARNIALGDPYQAQCHQTAQRVVAQLGLSESQYMVTFQSRFGRAEWLQPYTQPTLEAQAQQGLESVDLICPGFTSDCLETLEEINMEVREAFLHHGGKSFSYIPCLNNQAPWINALHDLVLRHTAGWAPAD